MDQQLTAAQAAWQSELDNTGRVTISSSFGSLFWRIGLAVVLIAVFVAARYSAGDIGQRGLTIAIIGFALLIIACVAFVKFQYGNKDIVVDTHGITMMDGQVVPWSDVTTVDVYAPAKSPPSVSVNLTQSAWDAHLASKGAAATAMHKANAFIVRDRALVIPSYLAANPAELASWLDQFGRGTNAAN